MGNLKLAVWNSNGLTQHRQEIIAFLKLHEIDVMLISETHFTKNSHFVIPNYFVYNTPRPDGKPYGGSAIIIRRKIRHHELNEYKKSYIQATSIQLEERIGNLVISAVYCPPKHRISSDLFTNYFKTLGNRFIAGGDYNAKHTRWGSRLITPKGRQLWQSISQANSSTLSTGHPTYWPTDRRKIPDLIDFCVIKGLNMEHLQTENNFDLSSDHSPFIVYVNTEVINKKTPFRLTNKNTNWASFKILMDEKLPNDVLLQNPQNIEEAVETINRVITESALLATPVTTVTNNKSKCTASVTRLIQEKRAARKRWQITRHPIDKSKFNKAVRQLRKLLDEERNTGLQTYLRNLTPLQATDYNLWKATKKLKQPQAYHQPIRTTDGNWARTDLEKANTFAHHLASVFIPYPAETGAILPILPEPPTYQNTNVMIKFKITEVKSTINNMIDPKKAPGYDHITGKLLKEVPEKTIRLITALFNAIIRIGYFPEKWKIAQIILIPKQGKDATMVTSYRPISLLPIISKIFEKLLLKKIMPIISERNIIPDYQFGFRQQHATIEQVHRIVSKVKQDLDNKRYCSAAFLDISQAFDKVWHEGLIQKIENYLPAQVSKIITSYLTDRKFKVKHQEEQSELFPILAGVPQGSVLGPVLYILYTADLPIAEEIMAATFADDTAFLSSNANANTASRILQEQLNLMQQWTKTWRIKINEAKSTHITFTLNKKTCPSVKLNEKVIPHHHHVKYLGMHLDRRLTWKTHIETKRKQIAIKLSKFYWLIGRRSQLSLSSKVLVYKTIIKPVWTYGIELWGSSSNSNIDILERFQSKTLRCITNAPWYVPNFVLRRDLGIHTVKEEISRISKKYQDRLAAHPNSLAVDILGQRKFIRLKRVDPLNLPNRYNIA